MSKPVYNGNVNGFDIVAYFDGACEPNPNGHIGTGSIVFCNKTGETLYSNSWYRKPGNGNTNNVAEFAALYFCLKFLVDNDLHIDKKTVIYGDSNFVVTTISKYGDVNDGKKYTKAAKSCKDLLLKFLIEPEIRWVPRDLNQTADNLSKAPLEARGVKENEWYRKKK